MRQDPIRKAAFTVPTRRGRVAHEMHESTRNLNEESSYYFKRAATFLKLVLGIRSQAESFISCPFVSFVGNSTAPTDS